VIRPLDRDESFTEFPDALFHGVDEESIFDDNEVWSSQVDGRFGRAITFDPSVGSRSNFYWSFRCPFHGVGPESILGEDDVWSSQAGWTVRKGHNL